MAVDTDTCNFGGWKADEQVVTDLAEWKIMNSICLQGEIPRNELVFLRESQKTSEMSYKCP